MVKNLFKKSNDKSKNEDSEFLNEFQKTLDKSIREEKTQFLMTKKLQSKLKEMAKILLNNGYSIDDINMFINSNKKYVLKDGNIMDD